MRERSSRLVRLGLSGFSAGKHGKCYHTGDDNRSVIQGMVELSGCMVLPGDGAGRAIRQNPTRRRRRVRVIDFPL
jgi:hypothetical protein